MTTPLLSELSDGHFSGGGKLATGELAKMLREHGARVRPYHVAIVSPSSFKAPAAKEPTPLEYNAALLLGFTLNTDVAYRQFKIPAHYSDTPTVHIHWTKTGDANEQGKTVRWRVSYRVFDGATQDVNVAPTTVDVDDTYDDAGTTTRIIHRTANVALVGFVANQYVAMKVEAVTPGGVALASEPGLFSLDLVYNEKINE